MGDVTLTPLDEHLLPTLEAWFQVLGQGREYFVRSLAGRRWEVRTYEPRGDLGHRVSR